MRHPAGGPELTTSTKTFVFTDIEGSTGLLRALGADYPSALREHDAIITTAVTDHGGEAFGSEGDAQHLVFDDAVMAVRAAVQAQRELAAHKWPENHPFRVRMGIHSGAAQRDESGFVGMVLHETARISAAGHGGQVLLSPAAVELARGRLPDGVGLVDLGEHRFKDIDQPLRIRQLAIDGLPKEFPLLRSMGTGSNHLPRQMTSFVDRREVMAIERLSESCRLVTLTGPGGTGKTRLALEVAERMAHRFADGTWFVGLDAVREADLVPSEVVTALGLSVGAEAPLDRLIGHLVERKVLLVLDNLEQVIDAGSAIARVIRECPSVTIIATSRTPLRVYGEQEFPVPALSVPLRASTVSVEGVRDFESVRLFEERARAAKPSFTLTDDNAALAADIVARLDGLPLAIELAAARLRMLPLPALDRRLHDRLGTLSGGSVDRPGRQQTLRGAIAWSHDLLDEPDRRLFARFGVIAGAAALTQTESIVGPAAEIGRDVFDGLESLTQQSLVRVIDNDEEEPRFAMLATIRQYAREQLEASGDEELVERRHAETYLTLAEEAAPELIGPDAARWNDRLEADHDDLRATLDWIVTNDEGEMGLRMVVALWRFWQVRGHLLEAEERVHAVLAMPSAARQPAALRSRAESAAGGIEYWRWRWEPTQRHYDAALQLARETDDTSLLAEAVYNAGFIPMMRAGSWADRMTAGHDKFEEALELYTELGDEAGVARASWSLAIQAAARDDVDEARALAQASLDAARSAGDLYQTGWSLASVGLGDVVVGDLKSAAEHIRESLDLWAAAGDVSGIVLLLLDAALVARARGFEACSWRLLGAEERLRGETGADIGTQDVEYSRLEPRRIPANGDERSWFDEGRAMSTDDAIVLARETALRA